MLKSQFPPDGPCYTSWWTNPLEYVPVSSASCHSSQYFSIGNHPQSSKRIMFNTYVNVFWLIPNKTENRLVTVSLQKDHNGTCHWKNCPLPLLPQDFFGQEGTKWGAQASDHVMDQDLTVRISTKSQQKCVRIARHFLGCTHPTK